MWCVLFLWFGMLICMTIGSCFLHYVLTKIEMVDEGVRWTVLVHTTQQIAHQKILPPISKDYRPLDWFAASKYQLQMNEDEYDMFLFSCTQMCNCIRPWWLPESYIRDVIQSVASQYMWYTPYVNIFATSEGKIHPIAGGYCPYSR